MPDEDDDKKYRLFDDDDDDDNIVLRFDADDNDDRPLVDTSAKVSNDEMRVEEDSVVKRFGFSKDVILDFSDKWQIPLFMVFMLFGLLVTWVVINTSDRTVKLDFDLSGKRKSGPGKFKSSRHNNFVNALDGAESLDDKIRDVEMEGGQHVVDRVLKNIESYLANYRNTIDEGDQYILDRVGDQYVETLVDELKQKPLKISQVKITEAIKWSERGFKAPGNMTRPKVDRLKDAISLYEEAGRREKDVSQYEKALARLDELVEEEKGKEYYYWRAQLNYKIGHDKNKRSAYEFVDASINSENPLEKEHRFGAVKLLGAMLAEQGQIADAEEKFASIIDMQASDLQKADTYFDLGNMRIELARQAKEDGEPLKTELWYTQAEESFKKAKEIYKKLDANDDEHKKKRAQTDFMLGTVSLNLGKIKGDGKRIEVARDAFLILHRRFSHGYPAMLASSKVRLVQSLVALNETSESERLLRALLKDSEEKMWNRLGLVTTQDVLSAIDDLATLHENAKDYREQVNVIELEKKVLNLKDKQGQMRHHFNLAKIWQNNAKVKTGDEARKSYRQSATTYTDLLDKTYIRIQKNERQEILWRSYQDYKKCYDKENLRLWELVLDEADKDSAIDILDRLINVGASPNSNVMLSQARYLKGLLQEDLNRYDLAIQTHERNIQDDRYSDAESGKGEDKHNVFIYGSYLRRAVVRSKMGKREDTLQAIKDCEELLNKKLNTTGAYWRDALYLSGHLNVRMAGRSHERKEQLTYYRKGITELDEAIGRYKDDRHNFNADQVIEASVASGLAKMKISHLDPLNSIEHIQGAIKNFDMAVNMSSTKNASEKTKRLRKLALMNLGMGYLETGGEDLLKARSTFERLSRSYRRDRVEPWSLMQLHRTYLKLVKYEEAQGVPDETTIREYGENAKRYKEKAVSSWGQLKKLRAKNVNDKDFPLSYWEDNDTWAIDLQKDIVALKGQTP